MTRMLKLHNVRYRYNGEYCLAIDEFEITRRSITGLAGPNGSGKTTLLKLLSGIEKPSSGIVSFFEDESVSGSGTSPIRHRFSLLPQETYLLRRSVFENIAYGLKVRGQREGLDAAVDEALDFVGLPSFFSSRNWDELSGGEAQRIALAARLVLKPSCLLLDEPTASVDMESARSIRRAVILARNEWGTTFVIASHHRSWLNDICDKVIYIYNGQVLDFSYENILTGPWERVDNNLVACSLSDGQKVYARTPPCKECSAVITPEIMSVDTIESDRSVKTLVGDISSITNENNGLGLQVQITCGDQRFIVALSEKQLTSRHILPGQKIKLYYRPETLTWLKK